MRLTSLLLVASAIPSLLWLQPERVSAQDGYMLKSPVVTLSLRGGALVPTASDPLHRFFFDELTLDRRDLATYALGADIAFRVTSRLDLVGSATWSRVNKESEFRDWVDGDDLPIEQTTTIKRTPAVVSARYFPWDRGRSVGQFAWVPTAMTPYIGAGIGVTWYEVAQDGWFVDFEDLDIFSDFFYATGSTPTAQAYLGTEWWPLTHIGLNVEGRYSYARANLRSDFSDFDYIDLGGFQLMAGFSVRF